MSTGIEPFEILEFIEAFRLLLSAPDVAQEAKLKEMMATYGTLCEEANRRLRECSSLSQKGLYANAVALAEHEPILMDRCSTLEIPERDILSTVASALGIAAPPLVNRDLVEVLQETYEKGASAEGNVRILHRLTLARAPLPTRLTIMRRLQIQDSNRPFIDTDIRIFERAWFKRVLDFSQPFTKAGNVEVLEEILGDLQENGYLETPPQQLIAGLQTQLAKAQSLQLPILAEEIKQAFQAGAIDVLRQLAVRWKQLVAKSGVSDASSRYGVADAFGWLNRVSAQKAKEAEIAESQTRLSELLAIPNAKANDVTRAFESAQLLKAVDPKLTAKYEIWIQAHRRGNVILAGSVAFVLVLLIAVVGIGYVQQSNSFAQNRKENAFIERLNGLVEAKDFKAASEAIKRADPTVARNPQVVALQKSVQEGLEQSDAFTAALRSFRSSSPEDDQKALARKAFDAARDDKDLKQVEELMAKLGQGNSNPSTDQRNDFEKRLEKLENDVVKWAAAPNDGAAVEYRKQISELREIARTNHWDVAQLDRVAAKLQKTKPPDAFAMKLSQFSSEISKEQATDESLKKTAEFLSSTLASDHPEDETKRRARAAKKDLPVWQNTLKLGQLFQSGHVDADVRKTWVGTPPADAIDAALIPMEMLKQRDFTRPNSEASKLKAQLQSPDIKDVYIIRVELAEPYCYWYTKKMLDAGDEAIDCKVITDVEGGSITQKIRGKRKAAVLSPQSKLLPDLEKLWLDREQADQWHQRLADAYERLADDTDVEPLLKLQLIRRFLGLAAASSIGYREILEPMPDFKSIRGIKGIVEGNWFDPKNVMSAERTNATRLCDSAPRLSKYAAEAAERDLAELRKIKGGVNLVGLLQRNEGRMATIARFSKVDPLGESRLYVISEGVWIEIGLSMSDDQIRLEKAANQFIGWPVFSVRSANSAR